MDLRFKDAANSCFDFPKRQIDVLVWNSQNMPTGKPQIFTANVIKCALLRIVMGRPIDFDNQMDRRACKIDSVGPDRMLPAKFVG